MAYCASTDIELMYGTANVTDWADRDGNGSADTGLITSLIAQADNEIDDYLRGGRYSVPFSTVPDTIKYLSAELAGVLLYEWKGVTDFDPENNTPIHKLSWHRQHVYAELNRIMSGERLLSAMISTPG